MECRQLLSVFTFSLLDKYIFIAELLNLCTAVKAQQNLSNVTNTNIKGNDGNSITKKLSEEIFAATTVIDFVKAFSSDLNHTSIQNTHQRGGHL